MANLGKARLMRFLSEVRQENEDRWRRIMMLERKLMGAADEACEHQFRAEKDGGQVAGWVALVAEAKVVGAVGAVGAVGTRRGLEAESLVFSPDDCMQAGKYVGSGQPLRRLSGSLVEAKRCHSRIYSQELAATSDQLVHTNDALDRRSGENHRKTKKRKMNEIPNQPSSSLSSRARDLTQLRIEQIVVQKSLLHLAAKTETKGDTSEGKSSYRGRTVKSTSHSLKNKEGISDSATTPLTSMRCVQNQWMQQELDYLANLVEMQRKQVEPLATNNVAVSEYSIRHNKSATTSVEVAREAHFTSSSKMVPSEASKVSFSRLVQVLVQRHVHSPSHTFLRVKFSESLEESDDEAERVSSASPLVSVDPAHLTFLHNSGILDFQPADKRLIRIVGTM